MSTRESFETIHNTPKIEPLHPEAPWLHKLENGDIVDLNRLESVQTPKYADGTYRAIFALVSSDIYEIITKEEYDFFCKLVEDLSLTQIVFKGTVPDWIKGS